jgi:hypothetical protein
MFEPGSGLVGSMFLRAFVSAGDRVTDWLGFAS